jgi:protein involved in temperature-dependent protein secretion
LGSQAITFPNLAPGTYRVIAYDRFQQINLSDPQQLAEIASKGQTVTVSPGATASVQLDLIHASSASPDSGSDGSVDIQ